MKELHRKAKSKTPANKAGRNGDRISLYPLTPDEAVRAILRVSPEAKEKQQVRQMQNKKRS